MREGPYIGMEGAPVFFFIRGWYVLGLILDGEPVPVEGPITEELTSCLAIWEAVNLADREHTQ